MIGSTLGLYAQGMLCALLPLALRLCRDRIAAVRSAAAAQAGALLARLAALAAPPDPAAGTLPVITLNTHPQNPGAAAARAVPRPPTPDPVAKAAGRAGGAAPAGGRDSCKQEPAAAWGPAAEAVGQCDAAASGAVPDAADKWADGPARACVDAADGGALERAGAGPCDGARAGGGSQGGGGGAAAGSGAGRWEGFDAAGHWVERLGELAGERCHRLRLAFLGACASVLLGAQGLVAAEIKGLGLEAVWSSFLTP